MTPTERFNYLIDELEKGSSIRFGVAAGIPKSCVSRVKNGKADPATYYPRILKAYPSVNREWLVNGEGEPLKDMPAPGVSKSIEELSREIALLRESVEKLAESFSKVSH